MVADVMVAGAMGLAPVVKGVEVVQVLAREVVSTEVALKVAAAKVGVAMVAAARVEEARARADPGKAVVVCLEVETGEEKVEARAVDLVEVARAWAVPVVGVEGWMAEVEKVVVVMEVATVAG